MDQKTLNLLGLATRARKIITGEDVVIDGMKKNKVKLVIVAKDASPKTIDKFTRKCFFYNVELNLSFNSAEIEQNIGKPRKILGLTDEGFTKAIKLSIGGMTNEGKRNN